MHSLRTGTFYGMALKDIYDDNVFQAQNNIISIVIIDRFTWYLLLACLVSHETMVVYYYLRTSWQCIPWHSLFKRNVLRKYLVSCVNNMLFLQQGCVTRLWYIEESIKGLLCLWHVSPNRFTDTCPDMLTEFKSIYKFIYIHSSSIHAVKLLCWPYSPLLA